MAKQTLYAMYAVLSVQDVTQIKTEKGKLKSLEECFSSENVKERREAGRQWDEAQPDYYLKVVRPLCVRFHIDTMRANALIAYVFYNVYELRQVVTKTDKAKAKQLCAEQRHTRHEWICNQYYDKAHTNNALQAQQKLDNFEIYLKVKYKLTVPNDWTGLLSEELEAA